jgi:hypothetical protein
MKRSISSLLLLLPTLVYAQVAITFSDDFNLEEFSYYDNWQFQEQSFFVLPLSINDYIAIESFQFNVLYDPQVVDLDYDIIDAINNEEITTSYNVENAISGQQGTISAEVFSISSSQSVATVSYSHTSPISEDQFDNGYAILVYLPFKKNQACSKAPLSISFSDGNIGDEYANPNQTQAIVVNESLTSENESITTQDAFVNFNILTADVIQNGNTFESTVAGGTPPYTYEWTDKMDGVLSTDSVFSPDQDGDYLFYVYDQNNCVYSLYLSFDATTSVQELSLYSVYPIPAKHYIEVSAPHFNAYKLININGQIVANGLLNDKVSISRKELPSGIYFLKLNNETEVTVMKVIFE